MSELEIENEKITTEFGSFEENSILSLAFENPEFFMTVMPFMELEFFSKATTKFIFALIFKYYKEKSIVVSRAYALDYVKKHLTTDMPYQEIIDIISKPLDPRDMSIIMGSLVEWCRKRAYSKLYDQESIESHSRGDYTYVEQVVEQARRVNDFDAKFYFFFNEFEALFEKENEEKFTTGFQRLDGYLNNGGPTRGEVVCAMAPTGVGKCHTLDSKIIIKTINDEIKEVNFGYLKNNNDVKILTPTGFELIKKFDYIKTGPTIKLITKYGELICDPNHRVLTNNGEKFVKDLSNDKLIGLKNEELNYIKEDGEIRDLYDIEIGSPHLYYTSGIVSHNSIFLVNNGAGSILAEKNVLHVTMELTKMKTAARYLGCFTNQWIDARYSEDVQQKMRASLLQKKDTYKSQLVIVEYPPDDISVDTIHMNIDVLKRQYGIKIDVVIIDYMELLISRNQKMFDKDYNIQKKVATEVCRLAKKEKVVVFTAFQTNRGGNENVNGKGKDSNKFIELDKVAESYGKTMSVDYIITLNQTKSEYKGSEEEDKEDISNAGLRFYIAKNRNGPKFQSIDAFVNYYTMRMREA